MRLKQLLPGECYLVSLRRLLQDTKINNWAAINYGLCKNKKGAAFLPMRHPFPILGKTSEELFALMLPDACKCLDASLTVKSGKYLNFSIWHWQ